VFTPRGHPGAAACLVAFNHLGDPLGKQRELGAFGLGVHRAGPIVVTQDLFEVVLGGVLVAFTNLFPMITNCFIAAVLLGLCYRTRGRTLSPRTSSPIRGASPFRQVPSCRLRPAASPTSTASPECHPGSGDQIRC
jgi:hypothetical protein